MYSILATLSHLYDILATLSHLYSSRATLSHAAIHGVFRAWALNSAW